jgi:hypothetical protein
MYYNGDDDAMLGSTILIVPSDARKISIGDTDPWPIFYFSR